MHYVNLLPTNYQKLSENARNLSEKFQIIIKLLSAESLQEAWGNFSNLSPLSPVIQYACPNLVAMWHQLRALFLLLNIECYHLKQWSGSPTDALIQQDLPNVIYVYSESNELCFAYKKQEGNLIRLGLSGPNDSISPSMWSSIHDHLQQNLPLTEMQNDAIFNCLANQQVDSQRICRPNNIYGDHAITEAVNSLTVAGENIMQFNSPQAALFLEKTLLPLQLVIQDGIQEKTRTSDATRRTCAEQEIILRREILIQTTPLYQSDAVDLDGLITTHSLSNT